MKIAGIDDEEGNSLRLNRDEMMMMIRYRS